MRGIKNDFQKDAVIGIIQDAIMVNRIIHGMDYLVNAFNLKEKNAEFIPLEEYRGIRNAFDMMGISQEYELCNKLNTVFYECRFKEQAADKLAVYIFRAWKLFSKEYFQKLNKKTVA